MTFGTFFQSFSDLAAHEDNTLYARADMVFPLQPELYPNLDVKLHRRVYFYPKDQETVGKSLYDHYPEELTGPRTGNSSSKKSKSSGGKRPKK
jgi:hypothetical protein